MGFKVINEGIEFSIPTLGTIQWGPGLEASWRKISGHDHTGGGNGAQLPGTAIADGSITSAKLAPNISFTQATTLTPTGTTVGVDFDLGNFQIIDLSSATGTVTATVINGQSGGWYRIKIIQGATKRDIIWPVNIKFGGGVNPTAHQNINSSNIMYLDFDGTNYLVSLWENDLA